MTPTKLKILLVLHPENDSWIIAKIVERLRIQLTLAGHDAQVKETYADGFDYIFWSHYRNLPVDYVASIKGREYFFVTHVDDSKKLFLCKTHIEKGLIPICMSEATSQDLKNLLSLSQSPKVMSIGSDIAPQSINKVKIIMSSSIYADGRKNEEWIAEITSQSVLRNSQFLFLGRGWDPVVAQIRNSGGTAFAIDNSVIDSEIYEESLKHFKESDLFIYTGFDEGSLGVLDAYLLNVDLLVSCQGFHTQLKLKPSQLFSTKKEFYEKLELRVEQIWLRNMNQSNFSWSHMSNQFVKILIGQATSNESSETASRWSNLKYRKLQLRQTRVRRIGVHIWYLLKTKFL